MSLFAVVSFHVTFCMRLVNRVAPGLKSDMVCLCLQCWGRFYTPFDLSPAHHSLPPSYIPSGFIPLITLDPCLLASIQLSFSFSVFLFPFTASVSLSLSSYLYSHSLHGALVVSHHKGRAVYRLLVTGWKRGRGGVRVVAAWTVNIQWCCWGCPLTDTVSCCITDPKWHAIKFKWHPPQRDHSNYDGSWRGGMAPRIFRKIILKVAIFRGAQRWKFWQMQIQYDIEMLSWPIADIYRRQYPVPVFIDEWKTRNHRFHQT